MKIHISRRSEWKSTIKVGKEKERGGGKEKGTKG
jgi:hypothetical protein